jgi:LmbE family N-acetylglucosaminyl deacetylase
MRPLYITAHYDDFEIGAGGTALKNGGISVVLYAKETHGTKEQAKEAAIALGIEAVVPTHHRTARKLVAWLDEVGKDCNTIIATSPYDSHPEHRAAASVARQVARRNKALWFMDHAIPGGYGNGPRPNHFVDFSHYEHSKYDAIELYPVLSQDELKAVMYRDRYYGQIHKTKLAEGFVVEDSIQ